MINLISISVLAGVFSGNLTITGIVCRLPDPNDTVLLVNETVTSNSSPLFRFVTSSELSLKVSNPFPGFSSFTITRTSSSTSTSNGCSSGDVIVKSAR